MKVYQFQPVLSDLAAARRFLRSVGAMCDEAATSPDPRLPAIALAVLMRAGAELADEVTR